jgi:hypothetical protein
VTTAKKYYPCLFRLDRVDRYVIWYSSDKDGLVRHDGRIVALPSVAALRDFAGQHGLSLEREAPPLYDWDAIEKWCAKPAASELDADTFLNAWNMLLDARHSDEAESLFDRAHDRRGGLYDKLFRSNNLPAITPPGAEYYATWTGAEIHTLSRILQLGIAELRQQLDCQ